MNSLSFLAIAIVVSIVGSVYWVLRNRTPTSPYSSIDKFTDRMSALDPSSPDGFSVIHRPTKDSNPEDGPSSDDAATDESPSDVPSVEPSEGGNDG